MIDDSVIDADGDCLVLADALNAGPLAEGALDIVLAARVEQFLEVGIVPRPPQLSAGEDTPGAALLPAWSFIGTEDDVTSQRHGDGLALVILAANDDQVANAAL